MKDLEWLKKTIKKLPSETSQYMPREQMVERPNVLRLINQLDPTPSNSTGLELPVIPDYVAAYIEEQKGICSHWFEALDELKADYDNEEITVNDELILEFILKQPDKFVDAYRSGYTVEEVKE